MNNHHDTRDPEEIERDIERTRAEVGTTLDALQSKLTPGQLIDQAFTYLRSSAPADFTSNLSRTVRENPVPVVLMGVGIAWLMAQNRRGPMPSAGTHVPTLGDEWDTAYGRPVDGAAEGESHGLRERAAHLRDSARDTRERVGEGMQHTRERMAERMHHARERAGEWRDRSREQVYRARGAVSHIVDEQPLVLGAIGVAIGAALGAGLPATRREDRLMGDTRDELFEKARRATHEKAESVERTVKQAARDVRDEVTQPMAQEAQGDYPNRPLGDDGRPPAGNTAARNDGLM